jgi:MerR family mercuric resistance operon transcriptional regulator
MSESRYTIGQLAKRAALPSSTLRYYERVGLLRPRTRTSRNYRLYDDEALDQLRFIRAAQSLGFSLEDISTLSELRHGEIEPCLRVKALVENRLEHVTTKIEEFKKLQALLKRAANQCSQVDNPEHCPVLEELNPSPADK